MDENGFSDIPEPDGLSDEIEEFIETPKKRGGFFNIITVQAIICTIVMIGAVLLGTFAPQTLEYCRKKYQTLVSVDAQTFFRVVNEKYEAAVNAARDVENTSGGGSVSAAPEVGAGAGAAASSEALQSDSASLPGNTASGFASSADTNGARPTEKTANTSDVNSQKAAASEAGVKTSGKTADKKISSTAAAAGGAVNAIAKLGDVPAGATVLPVGITIDFVRPTKTGSISSFYGQRIHPITGKYEFHTALDIAAAKNTPVYSAADGVVLESKKSKFLGNYVYIEHADGYRSKYGHLNKRCVKVGQNVKAGQLIGKVGTTGYSTGYHLHLQLQKNQIAFNPLFVFKYA